MSSRFFTILRKSWFLIGLVAAVGLAHWAPALGKTLDAHYGVKIAIIGFSFLSGLAVSLANLRHDLRDWRSHLFIQIFTFILTPLAVLATAFWLPSGELKYGVYMIAVLPPTLATCIAYTAADGGPVACAVINSVGGNLLGIFISPLLLAAMIGVANNTGLAAATGTIRDLIFLVMAPLIAGQMCRAHLPVFYQKTARFQGYAAQLCVLLVVMCAFSKSMEKLAAEIGGMWQVFIYLTVLHFALIAAVRWNCKRRGMSPQESAATIFCGTQKTMALGLPLGISFFERLGNISVGVAILPMLFYYLLQLLVGSLLIAHWGRNRQKFL